MGKYEKFLFSFHFYYEKYRKKGGKKENSWNCKENSPNKFQFKLFQYILEKISQTLGWNFSDDFLCEIFHHKKTLTIEENCENFLLCSGMDDKVFFSPRPSMPSQSFTMSLCGFSFSFSARKTLSVELIQFRSHWSERRINRRRIKLPGTASVGLINDVKTRHQMDR